jgi:hypothetical protein
MQRPILLLVLAQALLYLIVAPTVVASLEDSLTQRAYLGIQLEQIVFFLAPFVALYFALSRRRLASHIASVQVDGGRMLLLNAVFVAYEMAYWSTVARLGLFTRRVGTEVIAEIFGNLSFVELLVVRFHDTTVFLFPVLFLVIALRATERRLVRGAAVMLALSLASLLLHTLLNSRLQLVLGAAALTIVYLRLRPAPTRRELAAGATAFVLASLLLMGIVFAIREESTLFRGLVHGQDELFEERGADAAFVVNEWVRRVDCVDLIAEIRPSLERGGFEWGGAWRIPFFMMVGAFVDAAEYAVIKAEGITTAKSWMLERHTTIGLHDYYSCALTDAFGNFGVVGYLLCATYFAFAVALAERLLRARRPAALLLGVAVFLHVAVFEAEMFTHLFGWLKFAAAVILLLTLNPIRSMTLAADRASPAQGRAGLPGGSLPSAPAG